MEKSFDKSGATLKEAMQAGYKCSPADCEPKRLVQLCKDLGEGYHLASMNSLEVKDCVIQFVIGGGYDIEIYSSRYDKFNVVLWAGYGTHTVDEFRNVPFGNVGDRVMELVERNGLPLTSRV